MNRLLRGLSTCLVWGALCFAAKSYPAVKPGEHTFDVPDVSHANVNLDIESREGAPLYKLQCHTAGYTGDPDFDYSGDFECRLSSVHGRDSYSTLLTEDEHQSRDWESRGRFFAADLIGACAEVPQFGATREFRLRAMSLVLKLTDLTFTKDIKLRSLKLSVIVRSFPEFRSPIAEAVPLPTSGAPEECKLHEYFVEPGPSKSR